MVFNNIGSCFTNGSIHWIVKMDEWDSYGLLLFDCESEELRTMDLPQGYMDPPHSVFVRQGLLSAVYVILVGLVYLYEVWTMKEYGVASSWTKDQVHVVGEQKEYLRARLEPLEKVDYDKIKSDTSLIGQSAYVFEESIYLMDIGKPCEEQIQTDDPHTLQMVLSTD